MGALSAAINLLNFHAQHNFSHHREAPRLQGADPPRLCDDRRHAELPDPADLSDVGLRLGAPVDDQQGPADRLADRRRAVRGLVLLRALDEIGLLNRWARALLRILMVGCTPWYAYNSFDWSQSLATSCLIFSIALLIHAAATPLSVWRALGLSAVFLGLNLNFASDLYLLPIPLAIAYFWCVGSSRAAAAQALIWLAVVWLTLVPWMFYTWRATGTPLVKSTNQGHVLLIGLGQDPEHRFGITYSDGDPRMYSILRERLGNDFAQRFYASCSYEADLVLRPAFIQIITHQPVDYLDLVWMKLRQVLSGATGTYTGEFDEGQNVGAFGIGKTFRYVVRRYTQETGHLLQFGTTLLVPFAVWMALRRGQRAWALLLTPIAYQYASCSLAAMQPQYLSNLILLQLTVCANGLGAVGPILAGRLRPSPDFSPRRFEF